MSPSGQSALLKIASGTTSQYYIIDTNTQQTLSNLKPLQNEPTIAYTISWANNNAYLMLESSKEIIAYNIRLNTTLTLFRKEEGLTYTWVTDDQGFFYIVEDATKTDDSFFTYRLKQISLDGASNKYIIDNFYFSKSDEYIQKYRSQGFASVEFASAPECTYAEGLWS